MQRSVSSFSSSNRSTSSAHSRSRVTPFTNNKLIPDLNLFSEGPGTGKYSRPNSNNDITLIPSPAYTIPKAKRVSILSLAERTPGYYYYPQREKSPAYVIVGKPKPVYSLRTPSPSQYITERSKDYIRPHVPCGTIGTAARFNRFLTIF